MIYKVTLAQKRDVKEIVKLILRKYKPCEGWDEEQLTPWVKWFVESSLCAVAVEAFEEGGIEILGSIESLLLGRPMTEGMLNKETREEQFYAYDGRGNVFFIDMFITDHLTIVPFLKTVLESSLGAKEYLAFTRDRDKIGRIHKYKLNRILRYYAPLPTTE